MRNTYRAILHGDRLEWSEEAPDHVHRDRPVAVRVTILDEVTAPTTKAVGLQGLPTQSPVQPYTVAIYWCVLASPGDELCALKKISRTRRLAAGLGHFTERSATLSNPLYPIVNMLVSHSRGDCPTLYQGGSRRAVFHPRAEAPGLSYRDYCVSPAGGDRGQRMAAALERLAASQALPDLPDPATWEREARGNVPYRAGMGDAH